MHESLLTAWPRLVWWQAQDEEGAHLRDQLKQAAHLWEEKGRSPDVLWSGTAFREFELWRERYSGKLTALEDDFARSMTERARRRKRLRRAAVASVIVALAAVAIAIGLSRQEAMRARDRAQAAALRAEASKLIALGRAEMDRYPTAAVAYGRKSLEVADTPEGRRFVVDALWRSPTARVLPLVDEVVWHADFSPDGRWLAAFPFSGHLLLFEDNGSPPRMFQGPPPTAHPPGIRFTPSGEALLARTLEERRVVHMYSVPDGREIRRFEPEPPVGYGAMPRPRPGPPDVLVKMTPLPQGILLQWAPLRQGVPVPPAPGLREPFGIWPYDGGPPVLIGSLRYQAYAFGVDSQGSRFLLRRGRHLVVRPLVSGADDTLETPVVALDEKDPIGVHGFDPQGEKIWSTDVKEGAGRLRVWSLGCGASPEPRVFSMPNPDGQFSPAWDSIGSRVAWGSSAENAVWLWDLDGPADAAPTILRRPEPQVTKQGIFNPRGGWLAVTNHDTLTFWPLDQPRARVLGGHANVVNRLVFTRDSERLLSCGNDSVRLWPLAARSGAMRRIAPGYRGACYDASLSPDGERLALVGSNGAWLGPSVGGEGRWVLENTSHALWAPAWDRSAGRLAVASGYTADQPNVILLFDLGTGTQRSFSLVPPGETGQAYDWGAYTLAFTPEGRLLAGGDGGVRWIDLETGASDWVWRVPKDVTTRYALSADARLLAVAGSPAAQGHKAARSEVLLVDLARGGRRSVASHGNTVFAVAMDAAGRTLVTGDMQGVVRVGLADGSEPHRLCCHAGAVRAVAVSPDGKWIASAAGGEIRLWPMPDLTKPPLHTLPHDELMAKLRALTNLQVVEDAASPTGYKLDIGPFPAGRTYRHGEAAASAAREPAVDVAPVRHPDDEDQQHLVLDPVDDAVVADTHPVEILGTLELLRARWARALGEPLQPGDDQPLNVPVQLPDGACGAVLDDDPIGHLQSQVPLQFLERYGLPAAALHPSESLPRLPHVDLVLDLLDEGEVPHGDDGGEVPAPPPQDDSLPSVGHAVEGVREVLAGLARRQPGHHATPSMYVSADSYEMQYTPERCRSPPRLREVGQRRHRRRRAGRAGHRRGAAPALRACRPRHQRSRLAGRPLDRLRERRRPPPVAHAGRDSKPPLHTLPHAELDGEARRAHEPARRAATRPRPPAGSSTSVPSPAGRTCRRGERSRKGSKPTEPGAPSASPVTGRRAQRRAPRGCGRGEKPRRRGWQPGCRREALGGQGL